jgi:hypothetical protein
MTAPTSPFAAFRTPPRVDAAYTAWNTVASYDDYAAAQRAVDRLSDDGFPVEHLDIIGSDLRLVERVTGRLTKGRAAAAGAASGAWTGLLVGLLLGLFVNSISWFGVVLTAIVLGAVWGAVFGFVAHAATRGARDFSSVRSFVAGKYDIIARDGTADQARGMLVRAGLLQPQSPAF